MSRLTLYTFSVDMTIADEKVPTHNQTVAAPSRECAEAYLKVVNNTTVNSFPPLLTSTLDSYEFVSEVNIDYILAPV